MHVPPPVLVSSTPIQGSLVAFSKPARVLTPHPKLCMNFGRTAETFFASSKGRIGSSVDQDGKSNVWAVEPKVKKAHPKSSENDVIQFTCCIYPHI